MVGAIIGDIIGSSYELNPIKNKNFELFPVDSDFTDDTVMTIAVAKSILDRENYIDNIIEFGLKYPNRKYGESFRKWLKTKEYKPYDSWGNGSAMRVSPIGFAFETQDRVLDEAKKSAEITHNHIEGIKGAEATALAIFMARNGATKSEIRDTISDKFGYNLNRTVDKIRPNYKFYASCQKSVPESIICFLDSISFEDCIKNCVSLGGDADTMGAIAGGIAEAYYGIPEELEEKVYRYLPDEFIGIVKRFKDTFQNR
jgi:ADP-ribosylglycohydrolase